MELKYEERKTYIEVKENGVKTKKFVGIARFPAPTAATLDSYIEQGVINKEELAKMYVKAKARRGSVTTETFDKAFGRLWNRFGTKENIEILQEHCTAYELNLQPMINEFLKDVYKNGEDEAYANEWLAALKNETDETDEVKN